MLRLIASVLLAGGLAPAQELLLNSFETEEEMSVVVPRDTRRG
jgi:hypothetical protein